MQNMFYDFYDDPIQASEWQIGFLYTLTLPLTRPSTH